MDALHQARKRGLPQRRRRVGPAARAARAPRDRAGRSPTRASGKCAAPRAPLHAFEGDGWVAFDRAIKAVEAFGLPGPVERWRELRERIHDDVCAQRLRTRARQLRAELRLASELDASLLLIPMTGFLPADRPARARHHRGDRARPDRRRLRAALPHAASRSTACRRARARSSPAASGSPTAYACSAAATRRARCSSGCCALRNDVGLLAEEYDPRARPPARQLPAGLLARRAGQHRHEPLRRGEAGRAARREKSRLNFVLST